MQVLDRWALSLCLCCLSLSLAASAVADGVEVVSPASSAATTYRVLEGRLLGKPLRGELVISRFERDFLPGSHTLRIDDFFLRAGWLRLRPRPPVVFEGTPSLDLRIADHLQYDEEGISFGRLLSVGEIVELDEAGATFHFLELHLGQGDGSLTGQLAGSTLPRRMHLTGQVVAVERKYLFPPDDCTIAPVQPIGPVPPGGGTGGGIQIGGGGVFIASDAAPLPAPTLEELGISAPDGASVSFDSAGVLTVQSDGDLFVADGEIFLPGLTRLHLVTSGAITIAGTLSVPDGVDVVIDADGPLSGGISVGDPGGIGPIGPGVIPFCEFLRPVLPGEENVLGEFSLLVSAAEPLEMEVRPERRARGNRVHPGRRGTLSVAILGSRQLDVRDVDEHSLRLGPGEAAPRHYGPGRARRTDVNGDGETDLVVGFGVRACGVALGDRELCVHGRTLDGATLEGCDDIETLGPASDTAPRGSRRRMRERQR